MDADLDIPAPGCAWWFGSLAVRSIRWVKIGSNESWESLIHWNVWLRGALRLGCDDCYEPTIVHHDFWRRPNTVMYQHCGLKLKRWTGRGKCGSPSLELLICPGLTVAEQIARFDEKRWSERLRYVSMRLHVHVNNDYVIVLSNAVRLIKFAVIK